MSVNTGVAARVNGEAISEAQVRAEFAMLRADREREGQSLTLEERLLLRKEALAIVMQRAMLLQEARRLKLITLQEEEEAALSTEAVVECLVAYWCRHMKPAKSTEVREYYKAHAQEFWRAEEIHAAHIVKHHEGSDPEANRVALEAIRERLLAGEDFAKIAQTESDCPERGGDLGFFERGVMVEEFDAAVFDAPLHRLSPVFRSGFGHHVAIVHERRPEGPLSLQEASPFITAALYRVKRNQEVGRRLDALQKSMKLELPA